MTEQTFVMLKPDAVRRNLIGDILARIERKGLTIVAIQMQTLDPQTAAAHYAEHASKDFYNDLCTFVRSGPVIQLVVEGANAIAAMRQLAGSTNPLDANVGTIRGDYATITRYNCIHASDGTESATREIALHFPPRVLHLQGHEPRDLWMLTAGGDLVFVPASFFSTLRCEADDGTLTIMAHRETCSAIDPEDFSTEYIAMTELTQSISEAQARHRNPAFFAWLHQVDVGAA